MLAGKTDDYFLTIARIGNLNQASQMLYVSQPSLTKYIQRLEERLGTSLFDRSTTPMKLNEAGQLYYRFLLKQKESEQALLTQIADMRNQIRGTLRFGIPPYSGQCYLPKVLPIFSRRFPEVKIELTESNGDSLEQALLAHEIDLAVFHLPIGNEQLAFHEIAHEHILAVTQRTGDLATVPEIRNLEDLLSFRPLILPQQTQKIGKIVGRVLQECTVKPKIYMRMSSVETTVRLAAEGLGTGFVPENGQEKLAPEIRERVSFYLLDPQKANWKIAAVYRKGYQLKRYEHEFLNIFASGAQDKTGSLSGLQILT